MEAGKVVSALSTRGRAELCFPGTVGFQTVLVYQIKEGTRHITKCSMRSCVCIVVVGNEFAPAGAGTPNRGEK